MHSVIKEPKGCWFESNRGALRGAQPATRFAVLAPFIPSKRHETTTINELSIVESQRIGPGQSHLRSLLTSNAQRDQRTEGLLVRVQPGELDWEFRQFKITRCLSFITQPRVERPPPDRQPAPETCRMPARCPRRSVCAMSVIMNRA